MRNKQLAAGCWPLAKNNNKGYFKIISIVNFLKTKIEPHRNIENIALNYVIYVSMWLFNSIKNNILYCNNIGSCKVILQLQKSNSETSISLHFANIDSKIKTILLLIILTTFIACGNNKPEEKEVEATLETVVNLTNDQLKNANIGFGKLEQKTVSSILKVNGKIDVPPQNMVSVSVPLGGYLKSTKLLPGMHVSKGEVIAVMEDQQYIQLQQDYLLAKAKLNFIQNEYNRQKELNQSKASSDKVFQQTESEFISQKITLKSLAEKLKLIGLNPETVNENTISKSINIYSPINGYVTMVNVNIGKYSQPSEVLFELVNPTDIHLALTIFEKDLAQIEIGQKLVAYTNNKPNEKHPCEIILVGHSVSKDRITEVHCHFLDYDRTLLPGMYMNGEIELKNNNVNTLPVDAIVRFEGNQYVFVAINKNNFEMVPVTVGATENGFIEIVNAKDFYNKQIVTQGAYNLLMTSKNKAEE